MKYTLVTSYRDGKEVGKQLFDGNNQVESLEKYKILHPEQADCILVAEDYKTETKEDGNAVEKVSGSVNERYDFVKAVEEVVAECVRSGAYSQVQRIDDKGHVTIWLEADWRNIGDDTEVVELFICFTDTGRIAYSTFIPETKRRKA